MAEIVGLAAGIVSIARAGAKLSTTLYTFAESVSRADKDVSDIAGDVELTANALDGLGKVFGGENAESIVSQTAIQDANSLIKRCEKVFEEISAEVEKRRVEKDGKRSLTTFGKFSWPLKEPRVEFLRRRLESLKSSLVLLLHVLQLAHSRRQGQLGMSVLEAELEKVRELYQHQQESVRTLQDLESKMSKTNLDDPGALGEFSTSSPLASSGLVAPSTLAVPQITARANNRKRNRGKYVSTDNITKDNNRDSLEEKEVWSLPMDSLMNCAHQVQMLLTKISALGREYTALQMPMCPEEPVQELYKTFCMEFEFELKRTRTPNVLVRSYKNSAMSDLATNDLSPSLGRFGQSTRVISPFEKDYQLQSGEISSQHVNQQPFLTGKRYEDSGPNFDTGFNWREHIDELDRPFKCLERACLQDFTYSGELLIHEREIHNMHGGMNAVLFCPVEGCEHSTGAGFRLQQTLDQHLRLVHQHTTTFPNFALSAANEMRLYCGYPDCTCSARRKELAAHIIHLHKQRQTRRVAMEAEARRPVYAHSPACRYMPPQARSSIDSNDLGFPAKRARIEAKTRGKLYKPPSPQQLLLRQAHQAPQAQMTQALRSAPSIRRSYSRSDPPGSNFSRSTFAPGLDPRMAQPQQPPWNPHKLKSPVILTVPVEPVPHTLPPFPLIGGRAAPRKKTSTSKPAESPTFKQQMMLSASSTVAPPENYASPYSSSDRLKRRRDIGTEKENDIAIVLLEKWTLHAQPWFVS
jgi:hypothetical protein